MDWEIKKIQNKDDFDDLENFYRKKFSSIYHNKLSADYLYWKLKKNVSFNGEMLVAIYNNNIVGSTSLTFKQAIIKDKQIKIAEIGDSYADIAIQRIILKKNLKKNFKYFHEKSIFGSLVNELLNRNNFKNLDLIYGVPNNKSLQGYTKHLNFKALNRNEIYNFVIPSINSQKIFFNSINFFLKFYRSCILFLFFRTLVVLENDDILENEIDFLISNNNLDLYKTRKYFLEKYKFNPEKNFSFLKVYNQKNLVNIYVIKKDHQRKKIFIVDYLAKKNFITHILLKLNLKYNYSVSFWANNNDFNFFKKFFFTVFKRKKINIIIYNKQKNVEEVFFDNFYLGYSDSF